MTHRENLVWMTEQKLQGLKSACESCLGRDDNGEQSRQGDFLDQQVWPAFAENKSALKADREPVP